MLLQSETNESTVSGPEGARVTAQEFARAVAELELRREEEAGRDADSVSVTDVVKELELRATPEEILAQIQLLRGREETLKRERRLAANHKKLALCLGLAALIASGTLGGMASRQPAATTSTPVSSAAALRTLNPSYQPAALKEGQILRCNLDTIELLDQKGVSSTPIAPAPHTGSWQVSLEKGMLVVHVWAEPETAERLLSGSSTADVYSEQRTAANLVPLSLPAEYFKEAYVTQTRNDREICAHIRAPVSGS